MERHFFWWQGDTIYMRWLKEGKVHRVAKTMNGGILALYPTPKREEFSFEVAHEVDDPSTKTPRLHREKVKDEVMLRLLDGENVNEILRTYQPTPLGEEQNGDNRFSYYYAKAGSESYDIDYNRYGMFHICDDVKELDVP
ncbi:MAG: hypothetical protein AABX66_04190 [Nanoarchaeota archaeon]